MGQNLTTSEIDKTAAFYILQMDFQSLEKMSDENFCKSIQSILVKVIEKHFKGMDLIDLERRMREGQKDLPFSLDNTEIKDSKQVCKEVSTFFLQIANIYSAIVSILNPVFYKNGAKESTPWFMMKSRKEADSIEAYGICESILESFTSNAELFERLYFDTWENGSFTKMSEHAAQEYQNDLQNFYQGFTGLGERPASLKRFSDFNSSFFSQHFSNEDKNEKANENVLSIYGHKVKEATKEILEKQDELMDILNELFSKEFDDTNGDYTVRINPTLTAQKLQEIMHRTRKIILELHSICTENNNEITNIYQSFVQERTAKTLENQIKDLQAKQRELV